MGRRPAFSELVRVLTRAEQAVGLGSLAVIVSVFLTWKSYPGTSVDGLHSWGRLTLLVAVLTAIYMVARSPFFRSAIELPRLPVTDSMAYIIAGAVEALGAFMFSSHYTGGSVGIGFLLALVGAAATVWGGYSALRGGPVRLPERNSSGEQVADSSVEEIGGGGPVIDEEIGGGGPIVGDGPIDRGHPRT